MYNIMKLWLYDNNNITLALVSLMNLLVTEYFRCSFLFAIFMCEMSISARIVYLMHTKQDDVSIFCWVG